MTALECWKMVCERLGVRHNGRPGAAIDEIKRLETVVEAALQMREDERAGNDVLALHAKERLYRACDSTLYRFTRENVR